MVSYPGANSPDVLSLLASATQFTESENEDIQIYHFSLELIEAAFSQFNFSEIISVVNVGNLKVAELWHGPTGSFKDIALGLVSQLINYFLSTAKEKATVLVSTAGNTGGAVTQCFAGSDHVDVIVMYPKKGVDPVQELQMCTVMADNVTIFASEASSCDGNDLVVKRLFADRELVKQHNLMGLNSINIGRVLVQMVHFFYIYFRVCDDVGDDVVFSVPTGGCGNLAAGVIAKLMGLPVKFIVAVNHNDLIHRIIAMGEMKRPKEIMYSHANAIGTGSPGNMERILALLTEDPVLIARQMSDWESRGSVDLTSFQLMAIQKLMWSSSVFEQEILDVIKEVKTGNSYDICPQTAAAMSAARKFLVSCDSTQTATTSRVVCLSTATLAKCTRVAATAGVDMSCPPAFKALQDLPQKSIFLQQGGDWDKIVRNKIIMPK